MRAAGETRNLQDRQVGDVIAHVADLFRAESPSCAQLFEFAQFQGSACDDFRDPESIHAVDHLIAAAARDHGDA